MQFYRHWQKSIESKLEPGKVLVLYGPRQAGKTTLVNWLAQRYQGSKLIVTGDDRDTRQVLESQSLTKIQTYFSDYDLIVIDEAQRIKEVGSGLKLLVDHLPRTAILVTGSASLELANKVGEPLVGRQKTITLYPLSMLELKHDWGRLEIKSKLEELLIYGSYPEVLKQTSGRNKEERLSSLRDGYLLRDVLQLEDVRYEGKLFDLLKLLAFQIGGEVSLNELANNLEIAKQTVQRYLYLLQKSFVIYRVGGFSRNLRKEVGKSKRYYFYDNGVRNALIENFNSLDLRNDIGQLWENLMFMERLKMRAYSGVGANIYFWRTYDQKEIDLVEEGGGKLAAYEFKWSPKKAKKISEPKDWREAYDNTSFKVITRDNFWSFVGA